jgi:hypothetical protein
MTYQEELELRNKLDVAQFGLDSIVDLAKSNIKLHEAAGKDGDSITTILKHAERIQSRMKEMP